MCVGLKPSQSTSRTGLANTRPLLLLNHSARVIVPWLLPAMEACLCYSKKLYLSDTPALKNPTPLCTIADNNLKFALLLGSALPVDSGPRLVYRVIQTLPGVLTSSIVHTARAEPVDTIQATIRASPLSCSTSKESAFLSSVLRYFLDRFLDRSKRSVLAKASESNSRASEVGIRCLRHGVRATVTFSRLTSELESKFREKDHT